jgi:hypothetical protein
VMGTGGVQNNRTANCCPPHTTEAVESAHRNNWLLCTSTVPSSSPGDHEVAAPFATTSNNSS